jgi:glycosyltransferase involved in cell wall biosynthesis
MLTIVGDGEDRELIEHLVAHLGIQDHVRLVGYQSPEEVRSQLERADVFVLPSFAEGVPVSLMEAMAVGLPVVTTSIAGVRELVEDGISGYVVNPGDPVALSERVLELLEGPELRMTMGKQGRAKVEAEFDVRKEAQLVHELLLDRFAVSE